MVRALLGKKIGMTQVFEESGRRVPVTVLRVGPCTVLQVKTAESDNAAAAQIGFEERKRKSTPRPLLGHFEKAGVTPKRLLRDVPLEGDELPEPGQELGVGIFEGVERVDVIGISKGRGTAGVVRRHGFSGAPETHGGRFGRRTGSIGASTSPGHVLKGKRMPGHMGAERVTVRNLRVVSIDPEQGLMLVKGSVAGANGSYVVVRKAAGLGGA
ncbi:MAG: 50S ribosomal protein L3 [Planctomycetes bacterium SM23_32]|nr:MAG: 50S ribosomal protein L3 [Planctomycetes bacterium SM23_32]